ncbi:MAG: flagellar biosynthesis protein FlhB [Alphaproteobacteria bacterium]|nr:flagellar biosynthesis protein FlhB [Alphaproteobacteria bacterium]
MSEGEQGDDSQKTEDPTQKKIDESRKKGQVALSREVNNWVILLAGTIIISTMLPSIFVDLIVILRGYIENAAVFPGIPGGLRLVLGDRLLDVLHIMALPFIVLMMAAFLSPFVQVGPLYAPETIHMKWSKVSPVSGFKRLFSMRSLVEFAKGIVKIALIGTVGVIILYPYFDKFEHLIGLPMQALSIEIQTLVVRLMIGVLVVLMVLAAMDLVYQRYEHNKKMRMSRQEIKDEYKQTEGDPHVKGRLRQLRSEKARQRMIQAVPSADVVITNPTHYSIALKYDPDKMEAPLCVAKGIDDVALRIREVAKEHDIILFENRPLARTLYDTVEVDETIPPEQYKAVAEVISYVFKTRGRSGREEV